MTANEKSAVQRRLRYFLSSQETFVNFFKDVPQLFLRVFYAWGDESTVKGTFELF